MRRCPWADATAILLRERGGTKLKMDELAGRALATFYMPWRTACDVGPQAASMPPRVRIIDPAIHPFRVKAQRVRHAQRHPFALVEHLQPLGQVTGADGQVAAQPERIEVVDPHVIA